MKNLIYLFKPSQENLFSVCNTLLGIFVLMHYQIEFGFLFMVSVALYTIAMDQVYKACK